MLFVNYKINAEKKELLNVLYNNELVTDGMNFGKCGKVRMHFKSKNDRIDMRCEYTERATKDNDFLGGTFFKGRVSEKDGVTSLRGIILTAPLYHLAMLALFIYFIIKCISMKAISVVPICIVIFSILVFKDEFAKQSIMKKYIFRAFKINYSNHTKKSYFN